MRTEIGVAEPEIAQTPRVRSDRCRRQLARRDTDLEHQRPDSRTTALKRIVIEAPVIG